MHQKVLGLFLGALLSFPCFALDHTHSAWTAWLKKYAVVNGPITNVNYAAAKSDTTQLNGYLKSLSEVTEDQFERFTSEQRLAFLINAYNAFTVKLILDNYPVKSIKDLGNFFKSPWKKSFFKLFGEDHHLDNIEHDLIRKKFAEARIHFAVVCASKGCPSLRGDAFVSDKLDSQLEEQTRKFLQDSSRNKYDTTNNKLFLSMIFKWYKEDFVKSAGDVQAFVAKRMAKSVDEQTKMKTAEIEHLEYDWTLNEVGAPRATSSEEPPKD